MTIKQTKPTKKEKNLEKFMNDYNAGTLSQQNYHKIPYENRMEYLRKMIPKKYNTKSINFTCETCGYVVLFNDSGYISDEELLNDPKVSKKFEHV